MCHTRGMSSKRSRIVLIPGLLCDGVVWEHAAFHLGKYGDVAIADLSSQDSITRMAEDVLASHPGRLAVAGHSMGARVALEMTRLAPDRIERLALLDTGVHPLKEGEADRRQVMIDLAYKEGMTALAERWLPPMVHPDRHGDTVLMGTLTAMVERMTPELHQRQMTALIDRPDAQSVLPKVTCPVLLLVGRQDAWASVAQHEHMKAYVSHARLVIIENAGHFAPVERPDDVTRALLDWMDNSIDEQ